MSAKLNDLARTHRLESAAGNFAAVAAYCGEYAAKDPDAQAAVIATMNAAMSGGITEFFSVVFPRGARFNTAEEVRDADLDVQFVRIDPAPSAGSPDIIVSGHAGTREVLASMFPAAEVVAGNITADDVRGKIVAGTLPPHLVAETEAYLYASIREFDYSRDADLSGDELAARLVVNPAVRVTIA